MAVNQTNLTIVGRLTSDPDHKRTLGDVDVTKFRMASNERRYDREAQQWVDGDTLYVSVTCWRKLAFNVLTCLRKGDPVVVTGRLYTDEFEVDGKRRYDTRMEATSIGPDLARTAAAVARRKDKPNGEQDGEQNGGRDGEQGSAGPTDQLMDELSALVAEQAEQVNQAERSEQSPQEEPLLAMA